MIETQKGVPIPKAARNEVNLHRKYPFNTIEVGEMFFVPDRPKNTLAAHASRMGKQLGRKFSTRLTLMAYDDEDGWQPCDEKDEGAVLGIGVWRIE